MCAVEPSSMRLNICTRIPMRTGDGIGFGGCTICSVYALLCCVCGHSISSDGDGGGGGGSNSNSIRSMRSCAIYYSIWNGSVLIHERNDHYVTIFALAQHRNVCKQNAAALIFILCFWTAAAAAVATADGWDGTRAHNWHTGARTHSDPAHLIKRIRFERLILCHRFRHTLIS